MLENEDSDSALLARVAENLDALDGQRRAAGVELLRSLEALFNTEAGLSPASATPMRLRQSI